MSGSLLAVSAKEAAGKFGFYTDEAMLRPVAGDGLPFYGAIPDWLFFRVRAGIGERMKTGRLRATKRTE